MQKNPYSPSGAGSLQIVDEPYAPFLDLLHSDVIHAIDQIGARHQVRAGTTLMLEGEAANRLMIVRSGLVKVTALHPDGYEAILALRGVGELFGEIAAFDRGIRSASASALIPSVIQFISIAEFEQLIARHPRVAMAIIETLAGRVRESDAHRVQFAADGVPRRLARALPQPADSHGNIHDDGKITIDLPFTQDDLAGTVSASRHAVTKALKTWRDQGLVVTARRQITLLQPAALSRQLRL